MTPLFAVRIDRDPVRVGIVNVLVAGMRIRARDHVHAELLGTFQHVPEGIHVAQPLAAIVQRNLRWIKSHASARVKSHGIRMDALESNPARTRIVIAGIVLHKANCAQRIGLSCTSFGMSTKDSAHVLIPGPNSAAAVVAAVYPKNIRRLLAILLFLNFHAIVDNVC